MLEFMTWKGAVTGSEIWSETHVNGAMSVSSVTTDSAGHVSGGGGSGVIRSTVRNMRRVFVDVGNNTTYNFVCDASFAPQNGHQVFIFGARRNGEVGNYSFFHVVDLTSGIGTKLVLPAFFATKKDLPSGCLPLIFAVLTLAVLFAMFISGNPTDTTVGIGIASIPATVLVFSIYKKSGYDAEVLALSKEIAAYVDSVSSSGFR